MRRITKTGSIMLSALAIVGASVLAPLLISQPAFAINKILCPSGTVPNSQGGCSSVVLSQPTGGAASSSSASCTGRECVVTGALTINGNSSSNPGNKSSNPPNLGHPGSHGGYSIAPPPSGCSTIWSVANNNLRGQSPGFGSALTATCYGNGAEGNFNYYGIPTQPICNVVNGLAATTT